MTETKQEDEAAIREILKRVVDSVHNLDYDGVRDFIPDDGVYFGSVAIRAQGYDELYEKQFTRVWPNIDEFNMVPSSISVHTSNELGWAICLFDSSAPGPDGKPVERKGRMTFILKNEMAYGSWCIAMIHSIQLRQNRTVL